MMLVMDDGQLEQVREGVDALSRALSEERFRHVAGLNREPALAAIFDAHGRAADRETVAELRDKGDRDLAARVAALAAERVAAPTEESWRAADSAATGPGPDGPMGISDAALALLHERSRERRRELGRAVADAAGGASAAREASAEESGPGPEPHWGSRQPGRTWSRQTRC